MSGLRKPSSVARGSNLPLLGRTRLMSFYQRRVTRLAAEEPRPLLAAFLPQQGMAWVSSYFKHIFKGRYRPYPTYAATGHNGRYAMRSAAGGPVHVSISSDWATGTREAAQVAESIRAAEPDYTIHLGDIYYVGDETEVQENFVGTAVNQYSPVSWPKGAVGTFALPGNHEMYGGGRAYFTTVLNYCDTGEGAQKASFFCLESEHWRVLGLDTGYNSAGVPVLGSIPGIDRLGWVHADGRLQDGLLTWLRETIRPRENRKATLLLTHHQPLTAFPEEIYLRPAQQLREFFLGQEVVWLFGHEHRLAIYKRRISPGGFPMYARCIGHGGMPVECNDRPRRGRGLKFYDPRRDYPLGQADSSAGGNARTKGEGRYRGVRAGWNGFVNLLFHGPDLALDYRDLRNRPMFLECFTAKADGGLRHVYQNVRLAPGPRGGKL